MADSSAEEERQGGGGSFLLTSRCRTMLYDAVDDGVSRWSLGLYYIRVG